MKRKYINSMQKTNNFYKLIEDTVIDNMDYREIFDNTVQFVYGKPLEEYSEKSINAIMVNEIRHNYSNYESMLKKVYKLNRTNHDYIQYKNSVLDKISIMYPFLKSECDRQKYKLNMVKIIT